MAALKDSDRLVRCGAVGGLGTTRDEYARSALVDILTTSDDFRIRTNAVQALGRIGALSSTRPIVDALQDRTVEPEAAIEALGQIGDPRAAKPLVAEMEKNMDHSARAANVLGRIGGPIAVAALVERARDYNGFSKHISEAAVEALGRMGDESASAPLADILEETSGYGSHVIHKKFRMKVVTALGHIGGRDAIIALIDLLVETDDSSFLYGDFRERAAAGLKASTQADLGTSGSQWIAWWKLNARRFTETQ